MIFELILLFNVFIGVIITCKFNIKKFPSFLEFCKYIFILSVFFPFVEESVFRCTLLKFTSGIPYFLEINSCIFGFAHLTNYFLSKNFKLSLVQSILCIYLGFYLIKLDNLLLSFLVHMLYNFSIITISYIY